MLSAKLVAMANLTCKQGITTGFYWPIVDAATGQPPVSISNLAAKAQVRDDESPTGNLLFEFTANVVQQGQNVCVVIQWTAEQSMGWGWTDGYGDVLLYRDGEPVCIVWQGAVQVDLVVTHD